MLPIVDQGVFFEFVPFAELDAEAPPRLALHEVETDVDYAVALSTDSGIFSYLVGDTVRFTSRDPLRLVFSGRTHHTLNSFGEHVCGGELDRALSAASSATGSTVLEYAVATVVKDAQSSVGGHVFYVEFQGEPVALGQFEQVVDETISAGNEDYTTHRSYGLNAPSVRPVPEGTFYRWMKLRGKYGGQNKIPRVLSKELEDDLLQMLQG
jgi:hypothetical protein